VYYSTQREKSSTLSSLDDGTATREPFLGIDHQWESALRAAIDETVRESNPVLLLMTKRLYELLFRGLVDKPFHQKLASYSFASRQQEASIQRLVATARKLLHLNWKIHEDTYNALTRYIMV
jgi:hypothetical protein